MFMPCASKERLEINGDLTLCNLFRLRRLSGKHLVGAVFSDSAKVAWTMTWDAHLDAHLTDLVPSWIIGSLHK